MNTTLRYAALSFVLLATACGGSSTTLTPLDTGVKADADAEAASDAASDASDGADVPAETTITDASTPEASPDAPPDGTGDSSDADRVKSTHRVDGQAPMWVPFGSKKPSDEHDHGRLCATLRASSIMRCT